MKSFFVAVKRWVKIVLLFVLIVVFLFGGIPPSAQAAPELEIEQAPFYAPVASVGLDVPANVMVGEDFTFTAQFTNSGSSEGFGPFIDIAFPVTGIDGTGTAVDDGIDFLGATYLGATVTAVQNTFGAANTDGCSGGQGPVIHPYAVAPVSGDHLVVCGKPGDKLVTLQLPFGSFVPGQPTVAVTVNAHLSNLADVGTALHLYARGGYQYGATALDDWCCGAFDATILSHPNPNSTTWPSSDTIPRLFTITKAYLWDEDETATGPNFLRRYTVAVDIANGQTLTNLQITDTLPNNMQFVAVTGSAPPIDPLVNCTTPVAGTPGGTLTCTFASVTGGTGTADATMTFSFYIPRLNSGGGNIIDPASGASVDSLNEARATANWTPIDSRDAASPVTGICGTPCHTLTDRSIATQKFVSIVTDTLPTGYSSGDTLEYTLNFQISDFFAFDHVVLTDVLSDGQRYDATFTPTLQVITRRVTLPVATIIPTVDNSQIGNTGPNPPADGTDGTQTLIFDVTNAIGDMLVGGCINRASGGYLASCGTPGDNGSTTGRIVFHATIQENFTDTYPSGDPSVDHGDELGNALTVSGILLDHMDPAFPPTAAIVSDGSATEIVIEFGTLAKSIYAINGAPCEPCTAQINAGVSPGDTVTFRLNYTQPASNFEETVITDYLPLPVFDAAEVTDFDGNTVCGVPAAGDACLGADDTFHLLTTPVPPAPTYDTDVSANTISFRYEDYDSTVDIESVIDLLFTVTVMDDPFADGLFLTNQAHVAEGTTNADPTTQDDIVQIRINEPALYLTKAAVSSDNSNRTLTPPISAPISFNAPGTAGAGWSGGTINSTYLDAHPIDSNMGFVDAGDLIRFAIVVQNRGHSLDGAFDLRIRDILQPGYMIPTLGPGLNLQVYYGNGTGPISWNGMGGGPDGAAGTADDLFGSGIELVDPVGEGVCQSHDPNLGNDIIVITYDLQLDDSITLDQGIINTATLFNYASTSGGPNFIPGGLSDTATVQPVTTPVKSIVSTSEMHTSDAGAGTTGNPRLAAIGEVVRFRIVQSIPEGTITNFRLHDALPPGLVFLNDNTARIVFVSNDSVAPVEVITSTTLGPDPALHAVGNESSLASITPGFALPDTAVSETDSTNTANYADDNSDNYASGTDIFFKFGTVNNHDRDSDSEYMILEFNALVANLPLTQTGVNLDNNAAPRYGSLTTEGASSPVVRVRVVEPVITYGKTIVSSPSPPDAGGVVQYRLSFANANGANDSDAFDVHLTDTLPAQLQLDLASISVTLAGGAAGYDTSASAGNILDVTVASVPKGGSVTVNYSATIMDTVTPGQIITNASASTWTSLPGPNGTGAATPGASGTLTGERNGSSGVNDYSRPSNTSFTIASLPAPIKQITETSAVHTLGANVAIGEVITYGILLTFPEGTTPSDTVVDTLPAGLQVVGTPQVITSAAASGGALTNDFNGSTGTPAPVITTTLLPTGEYRVSFVFTNVAVNGDNVANNNTLLVRIDARVMDIAANATGTVLSNSATNQVGTGVPVTSNVVDVNVAQPLITFGKTIVSLPTPLDAGGVVHYQITYANGTGANVSTAMDVNITDTLAAALLLPSTGAPDIVITPSAGVGAITNSSTTSAINIAVASVPPGESVTVDFYPVIQSSVTPGQVIDNTGNSTWTSLSDAVAGERTGAGGPSGSPDNYAAESNVQFTMPASQTIAKQLTATSASHTSGSNVTIGEVITYDILLTFSEGMTPSDTVVDDLPTGLEVTGTPEVITTVAASDGLLAADFNGSMDAPAITVTGINDIVTFGFANVSLPGDNNIANNTLLLRFKALVLNVDDNDNADTLSNSATNQVGAAAPTSSNMVNATVVESRLDLTKQVTDPDPAVGEVLTFTLLLSHDVASTADAFDVVLTDDLPVELTLDVSSVQVTTGGTGAVTNLRTNHSANHIEVMADSLEQGATIQVTYQATVTGAYASSFHNDAVATWTSLPGTVAGERDGSGVPLNDYRSTAQTAIGVNRALVKNLVASNVTSTSPDDVVAIGEILTYQVVLTIPAGSTDLAIINDTLDSGLAFVDCADTAPAGAGNMHDLIVGPDITSTNFTFAADAHGHNVASCNHGITAANNPQISNSGSTIRWDLGRVTNAGAAPETIALTYRVIVLDVATNVQNTTLDNDVDWTWSGGTLSTRAAQSLRVVEPELQVEKTVDPEVAALGNSVTYSIEISHTSNSLMAAYDVLLTDGIPTGLVLDQTSVTVIGSAGLPAAVITTSPTQFTVYWSEFPLGATARVEFQARFVGPSPVVNSANVNWSSLQIDPVPHFQAQSVYNALSTERRFNPVNQSIDDYAVSSSVSLRTPKLPKTGFAPGKVTSLPEQPADLSYHAMGDLWLEIPRLGIKVNIAGVPYNSDDWNLTWLGNQAGYLEGTAYPTHAGNTGITAHAYLADGTPGPFVDLSKLRYGDQIIVHMGGQRYIYEVRENKLIRPNEASALKHEERPWLTLITCKNYNEATGDYQYRVSVRAVLVKVESE